MNELATAPADVVDVPALPAASVLAPDRHPAAVHLASLADGPGRVSMRSTLAHAAAMLVTALDACPLAGAPVCPRRRRARPPLVLPRGRDRATSVAAGPCSEQGVSAITGSPA